MRKILSAMFVLTLCLGITGCATTSTNNESTTTEVSKDTYESVLNEYSKKLTDATPTILEEFKTEAEAKKDNLDELAKLSDEKIKKLAVICNEAEGKMEAVRIENKDDESTYKEWTNKIKDVYNEESKKITDEYLKLTTN